ncbi:PREDICTED: uncharacterized protein LOC104767301 [Camelina sativa]|uniref:Uncharacterized protein LOC104767301 n=1 Tax=Camelina sativa TaxID=90675 RepID=A0ABM1RBC5_CAMSA|nr:PREDICTED: uncharacterized protein LOC104767301 [Camelina sativa]
MEIDLRTTEHDVQPLTGFDGDTVMTEGTIMLPVYVGGKMHCINFAIVDKPIVYNVILGTPWLHKMKAVASTYHQCVKFPTPRGIFTLQGDPLVARTCFIIERQQRHARTFTVSDSAERPDGRVRPNSESIVQVNIDSSDATRCVGIGADLPQPIKDELVKFLCQNAATFAWSMNSMTGIDPNVTCHELNVDSTFKPIKQRRRKLGPERTAAVNEEVKKLLEAGSIREVKYPDWLSNPVVVKKKNGKWRVCVDFTDLNKACPKDSFPLPRIDQLVEATAGNELLSFMDAYSGYNQIMMHKNDQEKTAFITDQGTYYYKVMPFGLKNAGATYQRLVNRMFAEQLGRTMEVYIDDMLVKSTQAVDHVLHLAQCFEVLNRYNMKLNPAKCSFGVTSGEFLGYLVTKRGIEANPKQISALTNLPSPRNTREVQRLTGRIAALNRFISRSTDKCLPFYQLLRSNKKFEWDEKCESAFQELKHYLATPPVLAKPDQGETLYLYIAVSGSAVSGVLIKEDRGEQHPIFYVSKSLDGAELRYPTLEKLAYAVVISARNLRPYFQSHTVEVLTNQPLRTILHSPSQSGRLAKWAVELSEYDIEYKNRTCAKSQVLADFLIELPPELEFGCPREEKWTLHVDGASSRHGSGIGIHLAGSIREVKYPDWLSNPVVVKKKNGKWRVCVDFTDLNKACPKDSFPLPRIDQLVEATAGNELLSFMDAYSGYNQIMMHKNDQEKTAFITDQGTYCYKVMPFGLKNAGATYQRLVNRMFAEQLARTMEVYIDDMLAKPTQKSEPTKSKNLCGRTSFAGTEFRMRSSPTTARNSLRSNSKVCAKWRIRLSKSSPRYPQGNGQAEATNKTIIDGLKKRLEDKKGLWTDELDGVLWLHRTSPRRSTGKTPFSLAHGMEALAPEEIGVPTLRRSMLVHDPTLNAKMMLDTLDTLEEERDKALLRI